MYSHSPTRRDTCPTRSPSSSSAVYYAPEPGTEGFIEHRGERKVLCGYWAQECLRIEGVAETGFLGSEWVGEGSTVNRRAGDEHAGSIVYLGACGGKLARSSKRTPFRAGGDDHAGVARRSPIARRRGQSSLQQELRVLGQPEECPSTSVSARPTRRSLLRALRVRKRSSPLEEPTSFHLRHPLPLSGNVHHIPSLNLCPHKRRSGLGGSFIASSPSSSMRQTHPAPSASLTRRVLRKTPIAGLNASLNYGRRIRNSTNEPQHR